MYFGVDLAKHTRVRLEILPKKNTKWHDTAVGVSQKQTKKSPGSQSAVDAFRRELQMISLETKSGRFKTNTNATEKCAVKLYDGLMEG